MNSWIIVTCKASGGQDARVGHCTIGSGKSFFQEFVSAEVSHRPCLWESDIEAKFDS